MYILGNDAKSVLADRSPIKSQIQTEHTGMQKA